MNMNELELIEKKDLRDELIERIDVLDKVKKLLLLGNTEFATLDHVAIYYDTTKRWIENLLETNRDEFIEDGYKVFKANDFKTELEFGIKNVKSYRGKFIVQFSDNTKQTFSPRGVGLFPRRAILRVGMLLRDSEIAKEVRTQLLNIESRVTKEQKILSITEEQQLVLNVMYATNESERLLAFSKFNDYKNRYINILEDKNKALVEGILTWNAREAINRMVRIIAAKTFSNKFGKAWNKIYAEMLYKHNINVVSRIRYSKVKRATIFDVLDDEEIKLLVKSCLSLCEMYKINVDDLFIDLK
jgi:hypothetical protein